MEIEVELGSKSQTPNLTYQVTIREKYGKIRGRVRGNAREKHENCTGYARGLRVGAHAEMLVKMLVACARGISRKNAQENKRKINIEEQKGRQSRYLFAN